MILGFDIEVTLIKDNGKAGGNEVLAKIGSGLSANCGTDFPLALYEVLNLAEKSSSHKQFVIMLTDEDIHGDIDLDDLMRYAKHFKTEVFSISFQGSDKESLQQHLGRDQIIYVENIYDLPEEMRKLAIRKA